MTVVYPEEFKGNQKFDYNEEVVEIIYWDQSEGITISKHDGMTDQIVLWVDHDIHQDRENYRSTYIGNGVHNFTTDVDCRYHSKNLDHLIKKLTQIEEIL